MFIQGKVGFTWPTIFTFSKWYLLFSCLPSELISLFTFPSIFEFSLRDLEYEICMDRFVGHDCEIVNWFCSKSLRRKRVKKDSDPSSFIYFPNLIKVLWLSCFGQFWGVTKKHEISEREKQTGSTSRSKKQNGSHVMKEQSDTTQFE